MQDRPTAIELLKAAQEFCERDLQPALTGRVRFHARVLQNVLGIIERELAGEEEALNNEWERLRHILHKDDTIPAMGSALADQVKRWNTELAAGIRAGAFDARSDDLIDDLSATVAEKLAIANPNYASSTGAASDRSNR
jgi:hypothetical protein